MNPAEIEAEPDLPAASGDRAAKAAPRVAEVRGRPGLRKFLFRLARRAVALRRDRSDPYRQELARDYLRLKIRQRLLTSFPSLERKHERVLGFSVEVFDYWTFVYLFEEIFVGRDYSFEASSVAPRIVDCGSNIGLSILYFKLRYPAARILGFECDPGTYELLQRNVRGNPLADVEVRNEALFPGKERVALYRDPNWQGAPFTSLEQKLVARMGSEKGEAVPPCLVPATSLSRFMNEPVDFLKMDIEGAELAVLEELSASGKLGLVRQMVVEYHHHIEPETDRVSRLLGLLESNGFGYQMRASLDAPFRRDAYQNFLVYAYRR